MAVRDKGRQAIASQRWLAGILGNHAQNAWRRRTRDCPEKPQLRPIHCRWRPRGSRHEKPHALERPSFRRRRNVALSRMELLHWVCFGLLPALAAVLLFVGAGGARFFSLGLAVAICVPFGMAIDWPTWPWQLDVAYGKAQHWLWWCFAAAGVVGAAYDLRLLPKWVLLTFEVAIVLLMPWLVSSSLRADWT